MSTPTLRRFGWGPIAICWLLVVCLFYLPQLSFVGGVMPFTDGDDSMRIVTATDLANGQAWQDKVEHRDNAPYGSPMHWSRLVDAPIAGLLRVTQPLLGGNAGNVVSLIWPPLLLLGLLAMSVGLTRRLLGPGHELLGAALPALSFVVLGEFSPGRVDHHNWQMILTTGLMWATISGRTSTTAAVVAGLLAATSLAIGVETLPFLVGAVLAFSLFWVHDPATAGKTRSFALAFAGGTLCHFLIATDPRLYFTPYCDELSDVYVVGTALSGVAMLAATWLGNRLTPFRRIVLISLLGALAGAVTLRLFPGCLSGPYGQLPPRAFDLLLAHVPEAQPLWVRFADDPVTAIGFAFASAVGLVLLCWCVATTRGDRRIDWLVLLLYLLLASFVMALQIRGARLAVMPAMPAGAWLIVKARDAYRNGARLRGGTGIVGGWVLYAGVLQFILPTFVSDVAASPPASAPAEAAPHLRDCYEPGLYGSVARLPAGIVLAPKQIGPTLLRYTPQSVVSAGYHRNVAGALDGDDFFHAGEIVARAVAMHRGVDYVVACQGLAQLTATAADPSDSFDTLYAAGRHWSWLTPISDPADRLQIFRVELLP